MNLRYLRFLRMMAPVLICVICGHQRRGGGLGALGVLVVNLPYKWLPSVDGVVVEKARRSIDDDEPSIEVDFLHDLRHIGHQ